MRAVGVWGGSFNLRSQSPLCVSVQMLKLCDPAYEPIAAPRGKLYGREGAILEAQHAAAAVSSLMSVDAGDHLLFSASSFMLMHKFE